MNRPTRVPASITVRMNSASNMMAKWYQNARMRAAAAERVREDVRHAERERRRAAGAVKQALLADVAGPACAISCGGHRYIPSFVMVAGGRGGSRTDDSGR